jgi:hypothetical protein
MVPDQRPPSSARAIAQPGAWRTLRRQVRSDALAVAWALIATGGEIVLIEMVRIPALNSLGLCIAVGLGIVALIRARRTAKVFRLVRRNPWRALESAWMYVELRERSACVLLRDPATGEQAALHVQRLPHRKAMPTHVLLPVWFAGDFAVGGVITPAGGGALMYARAYRTASARRAGLERTLHEELTAPIVVPPYLRGSRAREDFVHMAEWDRARLLRRMRTQRQRDRITVYDSFDLQELRTYGHVSAAPSDGDRI